MQTNVVGHILGRLTDQCHTHNILPCNICPGVFGWGAGSPIDSINILKRGSWIQRLRVRSFQNLIVKNKMYKSQSREKDLTWQRL